MHNLDVCFMISISIAGLLYIFNFVLEQFQITIEEVSQICFLT